MTTQETVNELMSFPGYLTKEAICINAKQRIDYTKLNRVISVIVEFLENRKDSDVFPPIQEIEQIFAMPIEINKVELTALENYINVHTGWGHDLTFTIADNCLASFIIGPR